MIELLVVVAIIIALLAILMPSMGQALEAANRTVCGSNQHQFYLVSLDYASDHFGKYPNTNRGGIQKTGGLDHVTFINLQLHDLLIKNYGIDLERFACPNRGDEFIQFSAGGLRTGYYLQFGRNSGWNHGPWEPWDSPTSVSDPGEDRVMITDIVEINTVSPPISSASHSAGGLAQGPAGTHPDDLGSEGANVTGTDGSVTWRAQSDLVQHAASSDNVVWGFW